MKTNKLHFHLLLVALAFLFSCGSDEELPKGDYESGVLILNEGNFESVNASVSHYNPSDQTVSNNIFHTVTSATLGDVAQSIYVNNDQAFVVVNNSDKVEVANAHTFETEFTIDALLPRYITVYDGKGYLSEWVSFTDAGRVSVVNLSNGSIESSITVGFGAENIIEANGKIFVSNNFETTVSVIDPVSKSVSTTIGVGSSPGQMVLDNSGMIWLVCGGGWQQNDGALYRIDPANNSVVTTIELEINVPTKIAINSSGQTLYYMAGTSVYSLGTAETTKPASSFVEISSATSLYGIGVDPSSGDVYIGDSKGFQGNGSVYRYSSDGTSIDEFSVGIGPNSFAFK